MKYGILGSGSATTSVVHEGLADILAKDPDALFVIHARKSPQGAVGDVYDFLIDHEVQFEVVTRIDDNAPKLLTDRAVGFTKTDDPTGVIIRSSDQILLLWDESNEDASEKLAISATDAGVTVLDLTMALTPIVVEGGAPSETAIEIDEGTGSVATFTRDELLNMSIGILRRQAKSLGIEDAGTTKEEIVNAILGDPASNVVIGDTKVEIAASDVHVPADASPIAVIVWYENGDMKTLEVPLASVKTFWKLT